MSEVKASNEPKIRNDLQFKRRSVIQSLEFEENIFYMSLDKQENVGSEGVFDYTTKKHKMPDGREMTRAEWFAEHYDSREDEINVKCDGICGIGQCPAKLLHEDYEDKRRVTGCYYCNDKEGIHKLLHDTSDTME